MCNPLVAVGLSTAATGFQAYTQYQYNRYNAKVEQRNAAIRERAAADAERRGEIEADIRRAQIPRQVGAQRAALAASGVDIGSGTATDITTGTEEIGEFDALVIQNNAAREAYGLRVGAMSSRAKSELARSRSRTQPIGTILGGGSRTAGMAERYGMFS